MSRKLSVDDRRRGVHADDLFIGFEFDGFYIDGGGLATRADGDLAGTASYNLCHQSDSWDPVQAAVHEHRQRAVLNWAARPTSRRCHWTMNTYPGSTMGMRLTRIEVGTEVTSTAAPPTSRT